MFLAPPPPCPAPRRQRRTVRAGRGVVLGGAHLAERDAEDHLPGLFSQRQLALRLLCRRLVRLAAAQVPPFKKAFLRALRAHPSAEREAVRTQFYAELRAAAAEAVFRRCDLRTAHLGVVLGVGEEERAGIERRRRRPTVMDWRSA